LVTTASGWIHQLEQFISNQSEIRFYKQVFSPVTFIFPLIVFDLGVNN
jgi:hypothetical protein